MAKILVVDDDVTSVAIMRKVLEDSGHDVVSVSSGKAALDRITKFKFDVMVTDFNMPGMTGIDLTKEVLDKEQDIIVILITAFFTIKSVVEAVKLGAFDYLTKPINKEELKLTVERGLEKLQLVNENLILKKKVEKANPESESPGYLTSSKKLKKILKDVDKAAKSDSVILITGENGTGKEVLANYIYKKSHRSEQPFVVINCAAIPSQLLESELFGHARGSFTGAIKDHKGYFEVANNGTLFLDEIGDLEPLLQVKLLRVLQEKEFSRVGDTRIITTNVRVIAATNRVLKDLIADNKFREDLYYRLNVFEFHLPSLKERPEDIMFYFEKFVKDFAVANKKNIKKIEERVIKVLKTYHWPGNIRELKNIAERVTILCETGTITYDLLPLNLRESSAREVDIEPDIFGDNFSSNYNKSKDDFIRRFDLDFITKHLSKHSGNVEATAKAINFHPVSLRQKIKKLGIKPSEFKSQK
ncbi:sigma-54-dependent Fis family transcriptional regulator [Ignavibacteria bacterium CHB1]|nr:MAG: sigma-54-dependent Fis family transcriptional regulator [Chlorobiota bacterium]KXK05926.1 MAG: response regulator [Chlorobi bacterium OLB4]MBV6398247.1 Regulatory protein AtoC [Ignavibacteria bacterium]MCC6886160.1 sigma-54-dependent Fis family transcriptional regulator [Ignavibacteriales bacterium]MCE7952588.1 sigma-54-dependent Fis family transcriptional regulator [Chlorobi bacterium CHB7]MDL1886700.1 sigma-54-dependent Fis family transcriptional regulator [Ignavibacteria bacterium C